MTPRTRTLTAAVLAGGAMLTIAPAAHARPLTDPADVPAAVQAWSVTVLEETPAAAPSTSSTPAPSRGHATSSTAVRSSTTPAPRRHRARVAHSVRAAGRWYVAPGETLGEIAAVNHTTVGAIVRTNRRAHPSITADYVVAGWHLRIPVAGR